MRLHIDPYLFSAASFAESCRVKPLFCMYPTAALLESEDSEFNICIAPAYYQHRLAYFRYHSYIAIEFFVRRPGRVYLFFSMLFALEGVTSSAAPKSAKVLHLLYRNACLVSC